MVKKTQSNPKVYIVEDILDTKLSNGTQYYRVKWKDYGMSEATWEPESSFHCSKVILNQFLVARSQKDAVFKDKLLRIDKEKNIVDKSNDKLQTPTKADPVKTKPIKKPGRKKQLEICSDQQNSDGNTDQQQSNGKQQNLNNLNKGNETTQIRQELTGHKNSQIKREEEKAKVQGGKSVKVKTQADRKDVDSHDEQNSESSIHPPKKVIEQPKQLQKTSAKLQPQPDKTSPLPPTNTHSPTSSLPKNLPQTDAIQILVIRKSSNELKFLILQNNKKVWKTRAEMHSKYSVPLCEYYEKHLSFDD